MRDLDRGDWDEVDWAGTFGAESSLRAPERPGAKALLLGAELKLAELEVRTSSAARPYRRRSPRSEGAAQIDRWRLSASRCWPPNSAGLLTHVRSRVQIEVHDVGYLCRQDGERYRAIVDAAECMDARILCRAQIATP
jgi:hypothetical protein